MSFGHQGTSFGHQVRAGTSFGQQGTSYQGTSFGHQMRRFAAKWGAFCPSEHLHHNIYFDVPILVIVLSILFYIYEMFEC